ncbi:MAG: hypothetical protein HW402_1278, partial [Dehalococcoidales bacterium]|nr:hypothetical protein [Dehalococcoidales bacterium]
VKMDEETQMVFEMVYPPANCGSNDGNAYLWFHSDGLFQ